MTKPYYFREATVANVDPKKFTCDLYYGDLQNGEKSVGVPLPNIIGAGNSGLIINIMNGTRVIAAYLHDTSREIVVIIGVLPSVLQKLENYNDESDGVIDKNPGTLAYTKSMDMGDVQLSAHTGPRVLLKSNDSLEISTTNGKGIFFTPEQFGTHSIYSLANNHLIEGSGGRLSWGRVKRSTSDVGFSSIKDFFTDIYRGGKLRDIGFWLGERVGNAISSNTIQRNIPLSEYKLIINEFSTEFGFSGFDKELLKRANEELAIRKDPTISRHRESTNSLYLSEGELIEIIGGNFIDINGLVYDINYNPISSSMRFPTVNSILKFEEASKKSRRGIGYHFKLSTNVNSRDESRSSKDFVFDVDKEGVLKVNVPKSSTTGNIPYVTDINFKSDDNPRLLSISPSNPSRLEKIPVHLRDRSGNLKDDRPAEPYRETGVRFANQSNDLYFPSSNASGKKAIRVNTTKHHNIYTAAERLLANYVTKVSIPSAFTRTKQFSAGGINLGELPDISDNPEKYSRHSAFEVKYDPSGAKDADDEDNQTDPQNLFYSTVGVTSKSPAISTGGDTFVAGKKYTADDPLQPIISNYFKAEKNDDGIGLVIDKSFENVVTHGGVSANVNMEGSLELSIGGDNVDNKSMILDTAGSLIMWLGKDKNNRSMIFQSDGDVLVNVGGSYSPTPNSDSDPEFNPGRFDLRVNVVDKGFHDSANSRSMIGSKFSDDKGYSSDYLISISDKGLVISGMQAGAPMIIRNDGDIMLESASSKLILKGESVEIIEFSKTPTDDGRAKK